jgi:uncharacterized protein (DUF885 family)
VGGNNPRID